MPWDPLQQQQQEQLILLEGAAQASEEGLAGLGQEGKARAQGRKEREEEGRSPALPSWLHGCLGEVAGRRAGPPQVTLRVLFQLSTSHKEPLQVCRKSDSRVRPLS